MSDTTYEISGSDWGDRAMYTLWQLDHDETYGELSTVIARATVYYPKDPDYGWVMEFSGMGDRLVRGLRTERYYYDGDLHSARFAASKFVEMYKDSLEKAND